MNESSVSQIRDLLAGNETVGIVVGKDPNIDAMGAALALYLSLQAAGKKVFIASATQPTVELSSLVGIDRVEDTFEGEGGDLIVSFPYKEGEIDKVSYTLEEGFLNIVVKPGELGISFTQQDVIFRRKGEYPKFIFTIGVPRISDLSSVFDIAALKDTQIINIGNNRENQGFGDVVVIAAEASSISEEVAQLILSLGFDLDLDIAQNLLSGIASATNNFQSPNTTPAAFEMAGVLMGKGAIRQRVEERVRIQEEESFFTPQNPGKILQELVQRQGHLSAATFPQQGSGQAGQVNLPAGRQGRDNRPRNFPQSQKVQQVQHSSTSSGQPQQSQKQPFGATQGKDLKNPPEEWLTPKVYKGSTNV